MLSLLLLGVTACAPPESAPQRIVLIVVDTLRRDHLSVYGADLPTPHIDALAARGQVFENFVASFHQTSMSMGAMFTGRTPSLETGDPTQPLPWNSSTWCGMARFADGEGDTCIPRSVPTLAEALQGSGWWTIGVVSNQFLYEPSGFGRGFSDWTEMDERKPVAGPRSLEGVTGRPRSRYWQAVNQVAFAAVERAPRQPAFLYVHYMDVHDYAMQERTYERAVAVQDQAIGKLLEGLEARGFLENAVVVFTADHGERLGEDHAFPGELPNNYGHYGNPSWDEMLLVPLIVAPPVFPNTTRFLRTQDVFSLLVELAGLAPPEGSDTEPDELFVSEVDYRTYRKGSWKIMLRRSDGKAHLYDTVADPDELQDLSQQKRLLVLAHRTRLNELTESLRAERAPQAELSEDDSARLRALGYLEEGGD